MKGAHAPEGVVMALEWSERTMFSDDCESV